MVRSCAMPTGGNRCSTSTVNFALKSSMYQPEVSSPRRW